MGSAILMHFAHVDFPFWLILIGAVLVLVGAVGMLLASRK